MYSKLSFILIPFSIISCICFSDALFLYVTKKKDYLLIPPIPGNQMLIQLTLYRLAIYFNFSAELKSKFLTFKA